MARILFLGDPHLRINKFSLALQFLSWANTLIDEQKPDLVVNLGDTFDTHAVIRSEVLSEFMNHVYHVIDSGIPYVYLMGNHDQYTPKDNKYHALLSLKGRIPNLSIVDEPRDLFGITFVPFLYDGDKFPRKPRPICVAHQTFLGADYGPVNSTEGVDPDTIDCDIIISGHIHKKHTLGKVVYVGSPYAQDASDVNQTKGISIFNTETYQWEFYKCPLPQWRSFKYELGGEHTIDFLHERLEANLLNSPDHWVLEIKGPKAEVMSYVESARYTKMVKNLSIRLKTVFTDKQKQKVSINSVSMEHIVSEFVNKVYTGTLNKDIVLARAKAVLEEVKARPA